MINHKGEQSMYFEPEEGVREHTGTDADCY